MVGFLQIMIWLFCVYLVFKGVEIFQIAFVSDSQNVSRKLGIVLGVLMTIGAVFVSIGAIYLEENMAAQMSKQMNNLPKF